MIISIGFRVNSKKAIKFRTWANKIIKEYMIKGFIMDDERLKGNGGDTITMYRCKICGKIKQNSTISTPKMCTECATITNRCQECGKLKK